MQRLIARVSIAWLLLANVIGLWLASLLLWPRLGDGVAPFTYGRWMPLHMDWQLYGWCSLPLLGILAVWYWNHNDKALERARLAFALWSAALLVGGIYWLLGEAVGKPFLNWAGASRWFFAGTLVAIWLLLCRGWWEGSKRTFRSKGERLGIWIRGIVAAALGVVPFVLYFVSDTRVYPPVDPDSGGATGHSLLASTLGIVALMGGLPRFGLGLGIAAESEKSAILRERVYWMFYGVSIVVYLLIQHGDASNRHFDQIAGLGSLLVWPLLLLWYWRVFQWSPSSRWWRVAFFFWWAMLALDGWVSFLPGVLEFVKFTNAMVAHAHLAMAGMVTGLNMIILLELGSDDVSRASLSRPLWCVVWNFALLAFVVVLTLQGVREGQQPGRLFYFDEATEIIYGVRWASGALMVLCSLVWLGGLVKRRDVR
ncbi:hypothetical protein [Pelagicoccus sp. SDUM812003]|uniref:hypothetical protein n=1 Tax=Pelagicoccus sp. SDUM812003 TaxID=3041267 RepID=UPI0028108A14|nr:hypothetical protein [Pelagicoccus sp. SDUM812003]MDQ8202253.1 hypothetical protein [Pelagicoccus sp. SDUM812003]